MVGYITRPVCTSHLREDQNPTSWMFYNHQLIMMAKATLELSTSSQTVVAWSSLTEWVSDWA
jgi:hypothetical protein